MAQHVTRFLPDNKPSPEQTPPLEPGDRLTRPEFERRYEAMPEINKAELINGIVYMGSPVRADQHAEPDNLIQGWLFNYSVATPGLKAGTNATILLGPDDAPQPDACLRIVPEYGGQSKLDGVSAVIADAARS